MDKHEFLDKLKHFFVSHYDTEASRTEGGCDTCGYGGEKLMTLEDIHDVIDLFEKEA